MNWLPHIVQAAHVRLLVRDGSWVLSTHLRHLPPMLRRASSWCGDDVRIEPWSGWVGLHVDILRAADRVSQLSCVDDVSHVAFTSLLVLSR